LRQIANHYYLSNGSINNLSLFKVNYEFTKKEADELVLPRK